MNFALALALIICLISVILISGLGAVALAIIMFASLLFAWLRLLHPNNSDVIVATLLALSICSIYISLASIGLVEGFRIESDAYVYDQVAGIIASEIPLALQLNPFALDYVYEVGISYGAITNPGFYKILGILYTFGLFIEIDNLSIQIPAIINIISYSLIGYSFYSLLGKVTKKHQWVLWLIFMTTPSLFEIVANIQKDTILLSLTLLLLLAIYSRYNWIVILMFLYGIATIRISQAALMLIIWLSYETYLRREKYLKYSIKYKSMIIIVGAIIIAIVAVDTPNLDIATESLSALEAGRDKATIGVSALLQTNSFGTALYGILYPFPNVFPRTIEAVIQTAYAYIYLTLLILIFFKFKKDSLMNAPFIFVLWIAVLIMSAGFAVNAIISWKALGFVVIDSRYKLLSYVCLLIIGSHRLASPAMAWKSVSSKDIGRLPLTEIGQSPLY